MKHFLRRYEEMALNKKSPGRWEWRGAIFLSVLEREVSPPIHCHTAGYILYTGADTTIESRSKARINCWVWIQLDVNMPEGKSWHKVADNHCRTATTECPCIQRDVTLCGGRFRLTMSMVLGVLLLTQYVKVTIWTQSSKHLCGVYRLSSSYILASGLISTMTRLILVVHSQILNIGARIFCMTIQMDKTCCILQQNDLANTCWRQCSVKGINTDCLSTISLIGWIENQP